MKRSTVDGAVDRAATEAERALAWVRIVGYGLDGLRAAWIWTNDDLTQQPAVAMSLTVMALAVSFSAVVLRRTRTVVSTPAWRMASVTLDMLLCTLSLSVTVLWPGSGYAGILAFPDPYILLLMVVAAGFRLSGPVALAGGALATVGAGVLIALDGQLNAAATASSAPHLSFFTMLLVVATIVAWLIAVRTRSIAARGAQDALRAEQARHDLDQLLRGHHDLSSALSAAALDSRALARSLADDEHLGELAADVQAGVNRLTDQIRTLREHAWVAAGSLEAPEIDVAAALEDVLATVRVDWPGVRVEVGAVPDGPVAMPGGQAVLRHIVQNLVVNACEGDGRRGARRVEVRIAVDDGRIAVDVRDDGPGFSSAQLRRALDVRGTTKRRGSGLGLMMLQRLAEQLGGAVRRANRPEGGARVRVELALAGAE